MENAFHFLNTNLALKPIYHKNDDTTMDHLHLGILACRLVNAAKCRLQQNESKSCWAEIVRIGNTQKKTTTSRTNT